MTLFITDIICTETILYRQEVTSNHLIVNKASIDAILAKNDDVIDLKF